MKAIFDTCSFECIIKYYIPIDRDGELKAVLEENFIAGEFILIDRVFNEISNHDGGIILKELPFLKSQNIIENTRLLVPDAVFYNAMHNFVDQNIASKPKNPITQPEISLALNNYLKQADGKILMFAHSIISDNPIIVTEETAKANDGKLIRKIPHNCSFLSLNCCNFATLLKNYFSINLSRK